MKKKDKIVLYNVEIEAVAAEGNALARVDGKVLFVPQCVYTQCDYTIKREMLQQKKTKNITKSYV